MLSEVLSHMGIFAKLAQLKSNWLSTYVNIWWNGYVRNFKCRSEIYKERKCWEEVKDVKDKAKEVFLSDIKCVLGKLRIKKFKRLISKN